MAALPPVLRAVRPAVVTLLVVLAALTLAVVGAGSAGAAAAETGAGAAAPRVHHMLPANGAVLPAAPDHVEIMFDVDLVPGQVAVGVASDGTGRLIALPGPPVLDGPVLVQPLPRLPAGHYTVGVQVRGTGGQLARGVFGFAVDPSAPAPTVADAGSGSSAPARWLVPVVGAALLLPAAGVALTRRRRAPRSGPASPGCASGRTPTSASSPAVPPRR